MRERLRVEELEERIAPAVVLVGGAISWTDSNGDEINVTYYEGPDGSSVEVLDTLGGDIGAGDDIGTITLSGADLSSQLIIYTNGGGAEDIVISQGIFAPGQDVGFISIGGAGGGPPVGIAALGDGFAIDVGGDLGTVMINGDFDCDTGGHSISAAGGDIGMIFITGDLHLDSGTGEAAFVAGAGGDGNISFVYVTDDVYLGSGVGTPFSATPFATSATIADDAGDGMTGAVTLKLSGVAAAAEYLAIPVTGGGYVLADVNIVSPNATLAITTSGTGGDIAEVDFYDDAAAVSISGAADSDVWIVVGEGSIGTIANKTTGGDIGVVEFGSGDVGLIQTGKLGNLGMMATGPNNSLPIFDSYDFLQSQGVAVGGGIGKIQVGAIRGITIAAGSIGTIDAKAGGIYDCVISVDNDITQINAYGIYDTLIENLGAIGKVSVGAGGIWYSEISGAPDGIGSVAVKGIVYNSSISSFYDTGTALIGGTIGSFSADALHSDVFALGGIGKVAIKGAMWDGSVDTETWDPYLGANVGGAVASFSAGGMYASTVESFMSMNSVKVGSGGMLYESSINCAGDVSSLQVAGDVDYDSGFDIDGTAKSVKIGGDLSGSSGVDIGAVGSFSVGGSIINSEAVFGTASSIKIGGGIFGNNGLLYVDGTAGSVSINGAIGGDGGIAVDLANFGSVTIKGDIYYAALSLGSGAKLSLGDVAYGEIDAADVTQVSTGALTDTRLEIWGNAGSVKVNGTLAYSNIYLYDEVGKMDVSGAVFETGIRAQGDRFAGLSVKGDVYDSDITLGVDGGTATETASVSFGGTLFHTDLTLYGPLGSLSVKGQAKDLGLESTHDIGTLAFSKSLMSSSIESEGVIASVTIGGSMNETSLYANGAMGNVTVKQDIYSSSITAADYDGSGDPLPVAMGNITADNVHDSYIAASGDMGRLSLKGSLLNSTVAAVAYDNYGVGSLVGGGSHAGITAAGIATSAIEVYGNLGALQVGSYGIGFMTNVTTHSGDFAGIKTIGIVSAEITVAGDLTGGIWTGGADALEYNGTYYLTDANGGLSEGTVTVGGNIAPGVVIS